MGSLFQDEITHRVNRVRPVAEHHVDRPGVYAWQHVQLTGTNRPRAWFYIANSMSNPMFVLAVEFLKLGLFDKNIKVSVAMAVGSHPFPFRTRKLSPPAPMVLGWRRPGRVGRRRISQEMGSREAPHFRLPLGTGLSR